MTAEYALKNLLGERSDVYVHSAGLVDAPHDVVDFVSDYLQRKGIDVCRHVPRKITADILHSSTVAVAMDVSHQQEIARGYGVQLPLFNEMAYNEGTSMLDVWEVVPDWRNNEAAAREYGHSLMDKIFSGMPRLLERLSEFSLPRV